MLETRLIRDIRTRQEADAAEAMIEAFVELLPELLLDAFKQPDVRTAIYNIVATAQQSSPTANPRRAAAVRRGGRRV